MSTNTVVLPDGREININPVPSDKIEKAMKGLERKFKAEGKQLTPPTYRTSLDEIVEWDKDSLEIDGTPQDHSKWKVYERDTEELEQAKLKRSVEVILFYAIPDDIKKPSEDWINQYKSELEWMGTEIPQHENDIVIDYITSVILNNDPILIQQVAQKAILLQYESMIGKEALEDAEATFQNRVEEASRQIRSKFRSNL